MIRNRWTCPHNTECCDKEQVCVSTQHRMVSSGTGGCVNTTQVGGLTGGCVNTTLVGVLTGGCVNTTLVGVSTQRRMVL